MDRGRKGIRIKSRLPLIVLLAVLSYGSLNEMIKKEYAHLRRDLADTSGLEKMNKNKEIAMLRNFLIPRSEGPNRRLARRIGASRSRRWQSPRRPQHDRGRGLL